MLPLLMLGLFTASSHQTDRRYSRLVSHIHSEVHALCKDGDESALLSNPKWMRRFRLSIPRTETGYLRRIQKSIDPRCEAACEIAFVLAYYHVDFERENNPDLSEVDTYFHLLMSTVYPSRSKW